MMKVLITGANGMVARAATRHCREIGDEVIALTRQDLDIADLDAVTSSFQTHRPDAVLNCAAYTDVDGAESNPAASRAANTTGVENLAVAAKNFDSRLITISTDYVFDGANLGFYTEDDEPNPQGVYAITKREGELAAMRANSDAVVVRSGWIYGEDGTNFLSVMHGLLGKGKRIKAIDDAYGTPTFALDLARRLRELAERSEVGLVHVTNANADLKRPAPRPVSSKLGSVRGLPELPDWADALKRFLCR
jgi:dTDP-4-dehydrorhamnose reductase